MPEKEEENLDLTPSELGGKDSFEELIVELGEASHGLEYFFNCSPQDLGDAFGKIHTGNSLTSFDLGDL